MLNARRFCVCSLLAAQGLPSLASAQTPVTIEVDAMSRGSPLKRVWAYHGYDEVNYTTTPQGEALLRLLARVHSAPVRVRTHFLFNTGDGTPALKWGSTNVYTEDSAGNPVYDYTLIDQIMDATLDAGAFPLVELGFMPEALSVRPLPYENSGTYVLDSGCFYPPRDYAKWGALVTEWAAHVKARYPGVESTWQWELWNEPDIGYWHGTPEEFAQLYDYTEAALHGVLAEASLGGPAVANPSAPFLRQFLEHCALGSNAVSGQTGTRLDMVTFHAKGGVTLTDEHVQMNLGNQLALHRAGFCAVAETSQFATTPIIISEADPDGCAACQVSIWPEDAYRNSPAYGAYEVAMMKRSLELAAELGVNLRGVLTWAFTFPDSPYFAGYRSLRTNGIDLPVLSAFKLLGRLSGDRLKVTSSGARALSDILDNSVRHEPDVDALAAIDGDRIQILVWNYHDDLVAAEPASVTLDVELLPTFAAGVSVTHERVDDTHGNAHAVWVAQGSPSAPSATQLAELREAMEPVVIEPEHALEVLAGAVRLSFELPRFGISLVTLVAANAGTGAASTQEDPGCSCRARAPTPLGMLAPLPVLVLAGCRRRFGRRSRADAP